MEGLQEIFTILGGSSPVVVLLAWHMWNQHKQFADFMKKQDEFKDQFVGALHAIDKRLEVIESWIEARS